MKEFMFFIRKQTNSTHTLSPDRHQQFLKGCERYIDKLKKDGRLISAQPIEWTGNIVSNLNETWKELPFNEANETIGGYFHILAKDLNEAIAVAKDNPEFQFNPNTRIEVRPVKMKEESTGYVYPKG